MSKRVIKPESVNWFKVENRAKIASKLNQLGIDNIIEIDADCKPIVPAVKTDTEIKN